MDNLWVVAIVVVLTLPLKGAALWKAARRGHMGWFLALLILNTFAILDLLYIFLFSDWGKGKKLQSETPVQATRQPQFSSSSRSKMTIV